MIEKEGPGWRLASDSSKAHYSYLLGGDNWPVEVSQEEWNILDFIVPPEIPKGMPPRPPITLRGKLVFDNIYGYFKDEKGWGAKDLKSPYIRKYRSVNGVLDFKDIEKVSVNLSGIVVVNLLPKYTPIIDPKAIMMAVKISCCPFSP